MRDLCSSRCRSSFYPHPVTEAFGKGENRFIRISIDRFSFSSKKQNEALSFFQIVLLAAVLNYFQSVDKHNFFSLFRENEYLSWFPFLISVMLPMSLQCVSYVCRNVVESMHLFKLSETVINAKCNCVSPTSMIHCSLSACTVFL